MQNKTRNGLIVSLSLLLAVSLTAIPAQAATTSSKTSAKSAMASAVKNPVVLRMTRLGDISQAFGPTRNSSGSDHLLNALIFSNLVKVAPDEKTILPDLATSWVASADASEFTFTLAQGVKWSDGKPFTAADVISSISMACHFGPAGYIGYQPTQWRLVQGCSDVLGKLDQTPKGLTKVSDYVVKIKLTQSNSQFVRLITDAVYSIVPANKVDGLSNPEYAQSNFVVDKPVGTGPYVMKLFKRNQYIVFQANPNYFGGAPKIDTIYFMVNTKPANVLPMLEKGELDLAIDIGVDLESQLASMKAKYKTVWNSTVAGEFFQFRADQGMAANVKVRQAVMYAIDRRSMLTNLLGGHGTIRWMLGGFDQTIAGLDPYEYNPTKAKALLKESGVDLTQKFEIMYSPLTDPAWPKMVPVMQQQLQAVGLNVVLNPVDQAAWVSKQNSKDATYALTLNSGGSIGLGASRSAGYFNCKAPLNSWYANCALDQLFLDLLATTVPATQDAIKAKIAAIINTDVPFITIWEKQTLNAVSTRLGGSFALFANDRDSTFNVNGWTMAAK